MLASSVFAQTIDKKVYSCSCSALDCSLRPLHFVS